jgi:hypothetical protein
MVVNKGRKLVFDAAELKQQFEEINQKLESLEMRLPEIATEKEALQKVISVSKINNLFASDSTIAILKYIKDNQDKYLDEDEGTTKQHVAKYMDKAQLLSRPSTLKLLDELLKPEHKIIIDAKKRHNARSRLMINPELDYSAIVVKMLSNSIKVIHDTFEMFNEEAKGANTELVNELLNTIENFKLKHKIEVNGIDRVIWTENKQIKNTIRKDLEKKIN